MVISSELGSEIVTRDKTNEGDSHGNQKISQQFIIRGNNPLPMKNRQVKNQLVLRKD